MSNQESPLTFDDANGDVAVFPEGESQSWWQPQPANGYAEVIVSPRNLKTVQRFSFGKQMMPPGGTVRLHAHDSAEEILHILEGTGVATVGGKSYPMVKGTTLYLGHNQQHTFTNTGDTDLCWVWFFMPGGLEDFFDGIGRPRRVGDAPPEPFARPENVKEIEKATVFAQLPVKN